MDYKLRSDSLDEFAPALIKFQSEVDSIKKNRKGVHGSSYADFDALIKEVTPNMTKNDLSVYVGRSFCVATERILLHTTILHKSDQWIKSITPLRWDDEKEKEEKYRREINQKIGAATTYQKRYDLANLLGLSIVADNDDNDGQQKNYSNTQWSDKVTDKQISLLRAKTIGRPEIKNIILKKFGVSDFKDLKKKDVNTIIEILDRA